MGPMPLMGLVSQYDRNVPPGSFSRFGLLAGHMPIRRQADTLTPPGVPVVRDP